MKRQKRLETKGYRITFDINGRSVFAQKGLSKIKGTSVTDLHKKVFGY